MRQSMGHRDKDINSMNFITCPGCGLKLVSKYLAPGDRYNASGECLELYAEVSYYTLSANDVYFIHQLAVDTFGAQHSGGVTKNITSAFALIGLCLFVEHNYTGRQIQKVHMLIPKQNWDKIDPPEKVRLKTITVASILKADSDAARETAIKKWAKSVWNSWNEHHDTIRRITMLYI